MDMQYKKRRRHKRLTSLDKNVSATYKIGFRIYKKQAFSVKDISGGGLRLLLPEKLKPGNIIYLDIILIGNKEAIPAKGEIIWSRKSENANCPKVAYDTGIQFIKIDLLSICKIYTYFQEHNLEIKLI